MLQEKSKASKWLPDMTCRSAPKTISCMKPKPWASGSGPHLGSFYPLGKPGRQDWGILGVGVCCGVWTLGVGFSPTRQNSFLVFQEAANVNWEGAGTEASRKWGAPGLLPRGAPDTAERRVERGRPAAGQARDAGGLRAARWAGPGLQPILEKGTKEKRRYVMQESSYRLEKGDLSRLLLEPCPLLRTDPSRQRFLAISEPAIPREGVNTSHRQRRPRGGAPQPGPDFDYRKLRTAAASNLENVSLGIINSSLARKQGRWRIRKDFPFQVKLLTGALREG